jgi:hypothetical protein
MMGGAAVAASAFPVRAGSYRKDLTDPALEFVKAVCRVLSLDASVIMITNECMLILMACVCVGSVRVCVFFFLLLLLLLVAVRVCVCFLCVCVPPSPL